MKEAYRYDKDGQTREMLDLCGKRNLPVLEFWVEQVCLSTRTRREIYLSELRECLPPYAYAEIRDAVKERLGKKAVSKEPAGRMLEESRRIELLEKKNRNLERQLRDMRGSRSWKLLNKLGHIRGRIQGKG